MIFHLHPSGILLLFPRLLPATNEDGGGKPSAASVESAAGKGERFGTFNDSPNVRGDDKTGEGGKGESGVATIAEDGEPDPDEGGGGTVKLSNGGSERDTADTDTGP